MSSAKHLNLFLLSFGVGLVVQIAIANSTNVLGDWVVLPAETAVTNWSFPKDFEPLWNPSTNRVAVAMQRLPDYLQKAQTNSRPSYPEQLPGIRESMPSTACQLEGVTFEKRKGIFLNCIPRDHRFSRHWKKRLAKVYDGGPRWWSVIYLTEEKKFMRLRIDLGY